MASFSYRTEELTLTEVNNLYVESAKDRTAINYLKSATPVVLVGSRGVGKSFLFKVAEYELQNEEKEILPVYVTFRASSVIQTNDEKQFQNWMLSRILSEIIRALKKRGIFINSLNDLIDLTRDKNMSSVGKSKIEEIADQFENSWNNPERVIDTSNIPTMDDFLNTIEDICEAAGMQRIIVFIDEAAHVFIPEQQRQFFTMFRDLRSAYINCNAAVYPGVTSYGDSFEPMHDAYYIMLDRNTSDEDYIDRMKKIVLKQVKESSLVKRISDRGENFALLAYASDGNPRHLLKTVAIAESMNSNDVNKVFRNYYKTDIWLEHSGLGEKYPGHRELIDWGRNFIETNVLTELKNKNDNYLFEEKDTSAYFWIDRLVPQEVKEGLRLLEYTGIISSHTDAIKSSKSKLGTRYNLNLGCVVSQEATPSKTGFEIIKKLSTKKMTEYGANQSIFTNLREAMGNFSEPNMAIILATQLEKSINILDLTPWQKSKLREVNLHKIGDVLRAPESKLMEAHMIGEIRSRTMKNFALAAVYEYLSG